MAGPTDNPFAGFEQFNADLYGQWEQGMSTWWDQVLENPAFLGTLGKGLSASAQARQSYETAVDETLERAHLPTRADLVRVARIATLLEEKLLSVEDRLLDMQDKLDVAEKEALRARIDAAETRVALMERLDAMSAKLDGLGGKAPAPKKAPTRRAASKKTSAKKGS